MGIDIVLTNARLWRRDEDSMLISDGIVKVIGSYDKVSREARPGSMVVDVGGRLVIPGIADAHMHILEYAVSRRRLDLRGIGSIEELKERLRIHGKTIGRGWILGRGWDQNSFKERRFPTRWDLDEAVRDRPVLLTRICGHVAVANSKALELAGVDRKTPDPVDGFIGREEDGEPNGLLFEGAISMLLRYIKDLSRDEKADALREALSEAGGLGITEIHVMSMGEEASLVRALSRTGDLKIKVKAFISLQSFAQRGLPKSIGNLDFKGVKVFMDGSLGGRTAALRSPYNDDPGTSGLLLADRKKLSSILDKCSRMGSVVAVHAIGDRAIEEAVEGASMAGVDGSSLRIEHASLAPPDLLEAIAERSIPVVVQPHFILSDWWIVERLGTRARWAYPLKSMLSRKILVAGSSDAPVEPLSPWRGIYAACDRGGAEKLPIWGLSGNEAVTIEEALTMYINGKVIGGTFSLPELLEGMAADVVVLNASDLPSDCAEILEIRPYMTIVDGQVIYRATSQMRVGGAHSSL